MSAVLMIVSTVAAILLIIIVLLQNSKGGGLDSSFGNVNQLGGVTQSVVYELQQPTTTSQPKSVVKEITSKIKLTSITSR